MRSRRVLWGVVCFTSGTLLFAGSAHADRRSGLGGNLLIQDPDDLFPFPQYTLQHRNMIRLDYGATSSSGNGVMTLGNEKNAFGLALHRGDLLNPDVVGFNTELAWLGGVGDPFGNTVGGAFPAPGLILPATPVPADPAMLPSTVIDLSYGRALGDDAFGLRFGFGRGVQSVTVDDVNSKGSSTFFVGQVGYSILPPQGLRVDLSGNVMAAFGKSRTGDEDNNKAFDLRVAGLSRGYYPLNNLVDIGFLANLSVDNEHSKSALTGAQVDSNDFALGAMGGVGPSVHLDRAKIAAYGGFVLGVGKNVPDGDADAGDVSRVNFGAPMVNMAVEVQILDWLYARTAAQYTWLLDRFKGEDGGDPRRERIASAPFIWSAGLGFAKNGFYFDGVVQNSFVTNGPSFIGGDNGAGFLAMASMTYKFGDVFGNAATQPAAEQPRPVAPAVEPAPPPPPPPAPAADPVTPALNGDASTGGVGFQGSARGSIGP
jgi:hypothetical protein